MCYIERNAACFIFRIIDGVLINIQDWRKSELFNGSIILIFYII